METSKTCTTCKKTQPLSEFYRQKVNKDGHESRCKDCKKAIRHTKMAWIRARKLEVGCVDCGYNDHPTALQYDHIGDDKEFELSDGRDVSWARLRAEIAKCEVVCANCHSVRTYERRQGNSI